MLFCDKLRVEVVLECVFLCICMCISGIGVVLDNSEWFHSGGNGSTSNNLLRALHNFLQGGLHSSTLHLGFHPRSLLAVYQLHIHGNISI